MKLHRRPPALWPPRATRWRSEPPDPTYAAFGTDGNSENSVAAANKSLGSGTMEAIYFGNSHWQGNRGQIPAGADPEALGQGPSSRRSRLVSVRRAL